MEAWETTWPEWLLIVAGRQEMEDDDDQPVIESFDDASELFGTLGITGNSQ